MAVCILVVEDDPDLQSILRRTLAEEGFDVLAASDGSTALTLAAGPRVPDLIILDIGLPDADGRDVCRALRLRGQNNPVIFLTARGDAADRISAEQTGGDDYITKPFSCEDLLERARALLERRRRTSGHGSAHM